MTTAARTHTDQSVHWYNPDGTPCFEVPKAKGDGMRPPTVADARKLGLLPGVTHITRILDKPELTSWKLEQACLAILTTPKKEGEGLDEFVHRVLQEEKVHEQEAIRAREMGSAIHDALARSLTGQSWDRKLAPFVEPVLAWVMRTGRVMWAERILVGKLFAGRADTLLQNDLAQLLFLVDFKTTSKLPADSYREHKIQTAGYASLLGNTGNLRVITANVYISTKQPGEFIVHSQDDWPVTFQYGFLPLLNYWRWANDMPGL